MTYFNLIAVRVGKKLSANYQKTGERVVCSQCGATFSITGPQVLANADLSADQLKELHKNLADEHVDDKFEDHYERYEIE